MNTRYCVVVLVGLLLAVSVAAQTTGDTIIESVSPTEVAQGQSVQVTVRGSGLDKVQAVTITPVDDMVITVDDVEADRVRFTINMSCTAEVGKRRLGVGDVTTDESGDPLYFYGIAGDCTQAGIVANQSIAGVGGIFPAGGVEQGKTQRGYMTGYGLTNVASITVVGLGLTLKILPGVTDDKLPFEVTAEPKATLGGRGLIVVLKDGTQLRRFRDSDATLRFDIVEAKPEPTVTEEREDVNESEQEDNEAEDEEDEDESIAPVSADCPALALFVNGKPLGETIEPVEGAIEFTVQLGPGVSIQRVAVRSPNRLVQRALTQFLSELAGEGSDVCANKTKTWEVPPRFPDIRAPITIGAVYTDAGLERRRVSEESTLIIPGKKGFLAALLSEDGEELLAARMLGPRKRLERELTLLDITPGDLEALGITKEDILKALALWRAGDREGAMKIIGEFKKVRESRRKSVRDERAKLAERFRKAMEDEDKGDLKIDPDVDVRVFEIVRGDKTITKSKVTLEIPQGTTMGDGSLIVYIPKELAESVDDMEFSEDVDVIDEDPVVKWAFKNIPQEEYREYSFTVDGDAQNFEVVAQAAASKPAVLTRFMLWLVGLFGGAK
ncbi:MAG: hypothetical protein AABY13_04880 [Nanoarchaeota archaeon]